MLSAFGVEHGEISKATPWGQAVKAGLNRAGSADISLKAIGRGAAKGVTKTGGFLQKHPGKFGTALVGAGGAGAYKIARDNAPPPRKKKK